MIRQSKHTQYYTERDERERERETDRERHRQRERKRDMTRNIYWHTTLSNRKVTRKYFVFILFIKHNNILRH